MAETIRGWQCIGCGRVEAPQNCIGVCRDRKVELVYASELAEAEGRLAGQTPCCDRACRSVFSANSKSKSAT